MQNKFLKFIILQVCSQGYEQGEELCLYDYMTFIFHRSTAIQTSWREHFLHKQSASPFTNLDT